MKNQYVIRDKVGVIFVDAPPNAGYGYLEVLVDVEDLEFLKSWPGSWYGFVHKSNGLIYIRGTAQSKPVPGYAQKQPLLHRALSKPKRGENTVFKDGDSLNCRRDNLINLPIGQVYTPPKDDPATLPIVRGVHWRNDKKRYEVRVYHKGKGYYLGVYPLEKREEANQRATDFRELGPEEYFKKYPKRKV